MTRGWTIAGVKVTHDGAVAVLHDGALRVVVEREKIANNPRYSAIEDTRQIVELLKVGGADPDEIDTWVVDGWFTQTERDPDPRIEVHSDPALAIRGPGGPGYLRVAPYRELPGVDPLAGIHVPSALPSVAGSYRSHHHTIGHLAGSYCTSPYARTRQTAAVLVWDGGVAPRLYVVDPSRRNVVSLGSILPLKGSTYATVVSRFSPFRVQGSGQGSVSLGTLELSIPGKAMAYAALGRLHPVLLTEIAAAYQRQITTSAFGDLPHALADAVEGAAVRLGVSAADAIFTWQDFLARLLADALAEALSREGLTGIPLLLSGGCALNITWNSYLRDSGRFGEIWIAPFPNDSGSALGTACAEMMRRSDRWYLDWDVYRGPRPQPEALPAGWTSRAAELDLVAKLLHAGEPVVFLHGRAELGPRALGHRSILAAPVDIRMRDLLNALKHRESYRPVAPVCLAERATEVFDPGCHDPFMLFQHRVRPAWRDRVPAIVHADGTARLQTVSREQEAVLYDLLHHYEQLSGIPLLCNTSANYPGRGFFPSVAEALRWGKVRHVWSSGVLYSADTALVTG